jgi:hypothetical protein
MRMPERLRGVGRVLDRIQEMVTTLQREEDAALREQVVFLETRLQRGTARLGRFVASLDARARISVALVLAGAGTIVVSATVPDVSAIGSGYFLRFGILLLGVGLHRLLR